MKLSDGEKEILRDLLEGKVVPPFRPDDETPYAAMIKRMAMHDLLEFTGIRQDEVMPSLSKKGRKVASKLQ